MQMAEIEIFRIEPIVGETCYEYAESTHQEGKYPNQRYFTHFYPLYVGKLSKTESGGWGDGRWRTDYFEDNCGKEHVVHYSYAGLTCFREVSCQPHYSLPQDEPH